MKSILEFIPLILFFIAYKLYGVQIGAITLLITTIIQTIVSKLLFKKIEKIQLFVNIVIVISAGLTAYFDDSSFLKWKVTIVNALFALTLFISQFCFKKPLIKHFLMKKITLGDDIWHKLNLGWTLFFTLCMLLNLYVSYFMSDDAWYTFKVFGLTSLSLIATLITGVYLYPHLTKMDK